MIRKMIRTIALTLSAMIQMCLVIAIASAVYAALNPRHYKPREDQHPADVHESGYWFNSSGPHLKDFNWTDDNEVTELES